MDGVLNYAVLGWFVTSANIGFLIPTTIINVAAFIALLLAMSLANAGGNPFHPFHPRPVSYAGDHINDQEKLPDEWKENVSFQPMSVRFFIAFIAYFSISLTSRSAVLGLQGIL